MELESSIVFEMRDTIFANQDAPYADGRYTIRFEPIIGSRLTKKESPLIILTSSWFQSQKGYSPLKSNQAARDFWGANAHGRRMLVGNHGFLLELDDGRTFKVVE